MESIGLRGLVAIAIACTILGYGTGSFLTGVTNQKAIGDLSATITSLDTRSLENSNRIDLLEQELLGYKAELDICNDQISNLESDISTLNFELDGVNNRITNLLSDIEIAGTLDVIELVQELEEMDYRMDRSEAYRILGKTMSKPGAYIVNSITDDLFEELKGQYPSISLVEGQIKDILARAINTKIPSLVWYGSSCEQINSDLYDTQVITYFPLEIETGIPVVGDIVVARIALVVSGDVDVNLNTVVANSINVVSITIEE